MKKPPFRIKPSPSAIPPGVVKCVGLADERILLVVTVDGLPFKDVGSNNHRDFETGLIHWRKVTLPSLARSDARFFYAERNKLLEIIEVLPA
jgi:hypothetical protein